MNFINKKFFINSFYIKSKIYSSFIVFTFFNFDNILYSKINLYFIEKNVNTCFLKNTLLSSLIYSKIHNLISMSLIYIFCFDFFHLLNIYCNLSSFEKFFFIKFAYLSNRYYNRYIIYFIYFLFTNNIYFIFTFYFKKIFKKILFLLNFFIKLNYLKKMNMNNNININEILKIIGNLTILELNELIKSFEEKYNLSTSSSDSLITNEETLHNKTSYSLHLLNLGNNKISVIKIIREINNLGLKESKDLADSVPVLIKDNIDLTTAESLKKRFEDVGSIVEIK